MMEHALACDEYTVSTYGRVLKSAVKTNHLCFKTDEDMPD